MAHTPGPWQTNSALYGDIRSWFITTAAYNLGNVKIARVDPRAHAADNARLIAAAPELLEACENMVASLAQWFNSYDLPEDVAKAESVMRGIIAKAKGE